MKILRTVLNSVARIALLSVLAAMGTAANLWAQGPTDACSAPTVGTGTGVVGRASGTSTCGVVITVTAVDGNGNATAFFVTLTGNGNPYDLTEDTLVGVVNSSGASLSAMGLTSANTTFGGLFNFDNDGPCDTLYHSPAYSWCSNAGFTGYEGPDNTFTNISADKTSGTVSFTTPIPNGGSTWFALEGTPQSLTAVSQTGQPMNPNSSTGLSQQFVFNNTAGQHVEFDFDYTTAFNTNNDLMVVNNTIPTVSDQGITHATYKTMVAGTSLAMTDCFTSTGEGTDANGNALCAQLTLTCTNANNSTPAGDNCPQSTQRNLYWAQQLDNSDIGLTIPTGTAPSLAMGSDNWSPASCTLVGPEAGHLCPQSELTQFALTSADNGIKPGGGGTTSNSAYVAGCCELEWNTVPSVPSWWNSTTVPVSFTTNPPKPSSPTNNWVAAPNNSITWGEENLGVTPDTTFPVTGDQTVANPTICPGTWPAFGTVPPPFTASGTVMVPGAGVYEVHFFSTACDNQEELAFPGSINTGSPNNVAAFKTASFGVDQTAPTISAPVLSGGIGNNTFGLGSHPTASFTCTDDRSGLAGCGQNVLPLPKNYGPAQQPPTSGPPTGPLTENISGYTVPTSTSGPQTLTVFATDEASNQSSASTRYCVGYKIVSMDNAGNIGFTAPVLNPGSGALPNINSANVNQAIPLQVTVTDCNGNPITNLMLAPPAGPGTVVLTAQNQTICKVDATDNSISTAAAGNSGWQNLGGGAYQYNWKPLPNKGACLSFSLNLGDGIQHTAYFQFK